MAAALYSHIGRSASAPTIPLLSSMATVLYRRWPPALVRRDDSLMEAWNRQVRLVPRSPHGSRHMTSAKLGEFKPEGRISSADDPVHISYDGMISPAKQFTIPQGIHSGKNRGASEEFIAYHGHVQPTNSEVGNGWRASGNIPYGVNDAGTAIFGLNSAQQGDVSPASGFVLCSNDKDDAREENEHGDSREHANWAVEEEDDSYEDEDDVFPLYALDNSSHRDGSIYKGPEPWRTDYCIGDLNETRLEAMRFSDPMEDCFFVDGVCLRHCASCMLQFFWIKLAKLPMVSGLVELYGYIAVRDLLDPLRNYVVNIGRDEPFLVEQGSFIQMNGPKRGIEMYGTVLVEYDMKIKTGKQENEDLPVIDGVSIIDEGMTDWCKEEFIGRLHGDCAAVDIMISGVDSAFEATVEVVISEVQSNFYMYLGCLTSGLLEEIRLFQGAIGEPCALRQFVVAVTRRRWMDLKFKVGSDVACCSFKSVSHGCSTQEIHLEDASLSVKVTWSCIN